MRSLLVALLLLALPALGQRPDPNSRPGPPVRPAPPVHEFVEITLECDIHDIPVEGLCNVDLNAKRWTCYFKSRAGAPGHLPGFALPIGGTLERINPAQVRFSSRFTAANGIITLPAARTIGSPVIFSDRGGGSVTMNCTNARISNAWSG